MTLKLNNDQEEMVIKLAERSRTAPSVRLDEIISDEFIRTFRRPKNEPVTNAQDWIDKRDVVHFDFSGNMIYRAYNLLTPHVQNEIEEDIDDELRAGDKWDRSVEATNNLANRTLWYKSSWYIFFSLVKKHLYNYADTVGNPQIKDYKVASYWSKRMKGTNDEDYNDQLYPNYKNSHSHDDFDLGMIYYLRNPSRIYGTLIENNDKEIILPGDENSLLIHHSNVNHQPVMPQPIVANKAHRCVIVVDFKHKSKL